MSRSDVQTTKVYVGNLPPDARKEELERSFERYGKLHDVWVARNPPGFAFVEFYDSRDAKDACRDLDGSRLCGGSARVEISHGRGKGGGRGRGGGGGGGRPDRDRFGGRDDRNSRYDDRRSPPSAAVGSRSPQRSRGRSPGGPPRGWRKSRSRSPPARY